MDKLRWELSVGSFLVWQARGSAAHGECGLAPAADSRAWAGAVY